MSSALKRVGGMYQWWKKPLYVAPVVSPLQRGPDFSFLDGRKPTFTSNAELERRKHQVELGKRVVQYLAEIKEAENLLEEKRLKQDVEQISAQQRAPRAKGDIEIC